MGYHTHYTVTCEPNDLLDTYLERLAKISNYNPEHFTGEGNTCKWYTHKEDMTHLSKEFPDIKFRVDGEGEESVDIWVEWYQAGELLGDWNAPQIVIPKGFNPPEK